MLQCVTASILNAVWFSSEQAILKNRIPKFRRTMLPPSSGVNWNLATHLFQSFMTNLFTDMQSISDLHL